MSFLYLFHKSDPGVKKHRILDPDPQHCTEEAAMGEATTGATNKGGAEATGTTDTGRSFTAA
jgi:hypothetical protein